MDVPGHCRGEAAGRRVDEVSVVSNVVSAAADNLSASAKHKTVRCHPHGLLGATQRRDRMATFMPAALRQIGM